MFSGRTTHGLTRPYACVRACVYVVAVCTHSSHICEFAYVNDSFYHDDIFLSLYMYHFFIHGFTIKSSIDQFSVIRYQTAA